MEAQKKLNDRYFGYLLGLAVGDALGTTLEFRGPGTFRPIRKNILRRATQTLTPHRSFCVEARIRSASHFKSGLNFFLYSCFWVIPKNPTFQMQVINLGLKTKAISKGNIPLNYPWI